MNFSSAAVETKAESEPPTKPVRKLIDCLGKIWFAHARASVCTLLLHAPGLVSCVRQHASCQPCMELFRSCLGFAVLKKNLSLLEVLEFTPAASATTKGDICVHGTYTKIFTDRFCRVRVISVGYWICYRTHRSVGYCGATVTEFTEV